jgi:hypothetical protein
MRVLLAVVVGIVATVVVAALLRASAQKRATAASAKTRTLEEKLAVLESCGLKLAPPFSVDELLRSWSRQDYEREGFDLVLVGLGMTEEKEPWRNHCVNLWHFDTECIEDNGDYKIIAARMMEMSQGSLQLLDIEDHVDVARNQAWLSFTFRGRPLKFDCKVSDDWVDPSIFGSFIRLLKESDPSKIYVYHDLGAQDCVIGCVTRSEFESLKNQGLKFVPLT